jgi:lipopolysaccharide export system permease protein
MFLCSFYFLYVLFDFSLHTSDMHGHTSASLGSLTTYYFYNFIKRLDLLLPLSLLLTTINIITSMNQNRELLALQTSGLSLQSILRPFVISGFILCFVIGANFQFLLPKAQKYIDKFDKAHQTQLDSEPQIRSVNLHSGGKLLFSSYKKGCLEDVYWIQSPKEIWHFKKIEETQEGKIIGYFVDHIVRDDHDEGSEFVKKDSFEKIDMPFLTPPIYENSIDEQQPFENFSISSLISKLLKTQGPQSRYFCQISSQLYYKLAMPWFGIILVLGIIPFCTKFNRSNKNLIIYTWGLVGFITFFTIMDTAVILGENNIVSPIVAVLTPIATLLALLGIRFTKLR